MPQEQQIDKIIIRYNRLDSGWYKIRVIADQSQVKSEVLTNLNTNLTGQGSMELIAPDRSSEGVGQSQMQMHVFIPLVDIHPPIVIPRFQDHIHDPHPGSEHDGQIKPGRLDIEPVGI